MKATAKRYNVRWYGAADLTTRANVDVMAVSDYHAKKAADRLARELGVTNCRREIYDGTRRVE